MGSIHSTCVTCVSWGDNNRSGVTTGAFWSDQRTHVTHAVILEKVTFGKWTYIIIYIYYYQSWGLPSRQRHTDTSVNHNPSSPHDLTILTTKRFCSYHYPWVEPFRSSQEPVFAMSYVSGDSPTQHRCHDVQELSSQRAMLSWDGRGA